MDPATISLIFMGIRMVAQAVRAGTSRAHFVDELEAFLITLHEEGRTATPEEIMEWANKAGASNAAYKAQLAEFLAAIGDAPAPESFVSPRLSEALVVEPDPQLDLPLGTEG